jgi:glycosyltransferase involved in cell wall biosynthesis
MHLVGWSALMKQPAARKIGALAIGMNYFGEGPDGKPSIRDRLQIRLTKSGLDRHVKSGRVTMFCEDLRAGEWLQRLFGWPFTLMPHAVNVEALPSPPVNRPLSPPVFVALGFARHDKGTDLLQTAIRRLIERGFPNRPKFVIQWGSDYEVNGFVVTKDPALVAAPNVEFIDTVILESQYNEILSMADFAILPYRKSFYHSRLSRSAIDAVTRGIPMIYTAGTSMEEAAKAFGAGVPFKDEDAKSLADAICEAAANLKHFRAAAQAQRPKAMEYFSGVNQARIVLEAVHR